MSIWKYTSHFLVFFLITQKTFFGIETEIVLVFFYTKSRRPGDITVWDSGNSHGAMVPWCQCRPLHQPVDPWRVIIEPTIDALIKGTIFIYGKL